MRSSNEHVSFLIEREGDLIRDNQVDMEEVDNTDRITWYDVQLNLNNQQRHAIRDTAESEE